MKVTNLHNSLAKDIPETWFLSFPTIARMAHDFLAQQRSQQPMESVEHTFSRIQIDTHLFRFTQIIQGANDNRSLALEGVDKQRPVRSQPTHREDEKARRTLTLATTLYPNCITVYIWYIYTKLPYLYI
jgi:hypothetical protein